MRRAAASVAAALALGCITYTGQPPGPYSDPEGVQLSLFGDSACSDPIWGQTAMQCCTGWDGYLGHDNCYAAGGTPQDRFTCDTEFFACMALWRVPEPIAASRYKLIRKVGWRSFNYTGVETRGPPR